MAGYKHVLLAVDFSPEGRAVGQRAVELAQGFGARLSLIHVVAELYQEPVYDLMASLPPDIEDQLAQNSRRSLEELAEELGVPQAQCLVGFGTAKMGIINAAEENEVDLIVVGSHGVHGLELLLGSTANAVLHAAKCDVLAVRVERAS